MLAPPHPRIVVNHLIVALQGREPVSREHHVTREDLFAAVWERPLTKVAADYGISDVALKKICRKMEIPTPGVGYWRRRECGYPASIAKLQPLSDDAVDSVVIHPPMESSSVEVLEGVPPEAEIAAALAKTPSVDLHPLLVPVSRSLQATKADERGILVPRSDKAKFLSVTQGSLERAIDTLDLVLKGMEALGHTVQIDTAIDPPLRLRIADDNLGLSIEEMLLATARPATEAEKKRYGSWHTEHYDYAPTGRLTLRIHGAFLPGTRAAFSDRGAQQLADQIPKTLRGLLVAASSHTQKRLADEERARQWAEERRRYEERERRRRREAQRAKHLSALADQCQAVDHLRAFLNTIAADSTALADVRIHDLGLADWLAWARDYVDAQDPRLNPAWWDIEEIVPYWDVH